MSRISSLAALILIFACPIARGGYFDDLKTTTQVSNPIVKWQHFGPGMSGYIDQFWVHPTDPNAMFMAPDMGNSYGTWNRGDKWETIKDWDSTDSNLDSITAVDFSRQDPDFGMMTTKEGIYTTTNRGHKWNFLLDIDLTNSEKHSVITADPNSDNVWFIGAGQSWLIKFTHVNKDGLYYTPSRNHSKGFILKTTNKGVSWTKITAGIPADADFSKIIIDPRDSNKVYASCQWGVYASTNAGVTWAKVTGNGLPHNQPRDMASYYNSTTGEFLLYMLEVTRYTPAGNTITTTGGVYRTSDGGANWTNLTGNLAINLQSINSWGYKEKYWTTIANWLGITSATAKITYPTLPTSTFSQFIHIEVDPFNKDRIYLLHNFKHDYSFPPGNIWMTENGGTNWIAAAREGPYWANEVDKTYWQSRGNPLGVNIKYAHVQKEHTDSDNTQTGPRLLKVNSAGEVLTCFAQQMMRSTDNGTTWNQIDDFETSPGSGHWVGRGDSNLPGESLCLDTGTPGTYLFGSGEHGLWRNTSDGNLVYPGAIAVEQLSGQSKSSTDSTSIGAIAVHPTDPNKLYTLQFRQTQPGNLRYSPDNGATWQTLSTPIDYTGQDTNEGIKLYSLLIDPLTPAKMYFCVPHTILTPWTSTQWISNGNVSFTNFGVYRSTDGGLTWTIGQSGIPAGTSVFRLAIDPATPSTLYAALNQTHNGVDGGLYRSTNSGDTWSPMTLPAGVKSVNSVEINKTNGDLFIACGTYANDSSTGGGWVSHDAGATWQLLFDMPNVQHIISSPVNANVITAINRSAKSINSINPGAFVSIDGGTAWHKINTNLGQQSRIHNLLPDPYDANILWGTLFGSGFWKADLTDLRLPPTVTTYPAIQDADVNSSSANTVYGNNTNLKLAANTRHAYLQFNLAALTGTVTGAKLWVRNNAGTPVNGTLSVYTSTNGWDQTTVTWNLKNNFGPSVIGSRVLSLAGTWYDIDIDTSTITGSLLTLGLKSTVTGWLDSRESGSGSPYAAYLEITTTPSALSAFDQWMATNGLTDPDDDHDHDGFTNRQEYISGTEPKNPSSRLSMSITSGNAFQWTPVEGRVYDVYWSPDLIQPFQLLSTIPYPQGTYTDTAHSSETRAFYKLGARMQTP